MKKLLLIMLAFAICAGATYSQKTKKNAKTETNSTKSESVRKYEVKSGIIEYEHSEMMGIKTSSKLYFDDYGKIEVRENLMNGSIEMMGMKISNESHEVTIENGDGYIYSFFLKNISNGNDEAKKEITRIKISDMQGLAGTMMGMEMMKKMDYREEGDEVVAGLNGKKYSIAMDKNNPSSRTYGVIYKNIPLKTSVMGMEIIAKKVQLDATFPKEKLAMPKDYKIIDGNEMMQKMMNSQPNNNDDN